MIFNLSVVSWGGGSLVWGWSLGVDSGTLVGDISDISIISIAGVLDVLDSAIGKSDGVRSSNVGGTIRLLLSVEGSLGVVISNSVGVGVGGDLIRVGLSMVSWSGGVVGWSSVDSVGNNWSSVDSVSNWVSHNWSVDGVVGNHRGSVDGVGNWVSNHWGVDSVGSNNWSMVSNNWSVDSMGKWGVDSMGNWGMDSVGSYHRGSVGDHSGSNMWSKVSRVRDDSSNTDGSMVSNIRSGGSSSQTKESRDDESLKIFHC